MSRAFRLGILVLAGLVIAAGGIFLIGDKRFEFRRTYELKAQFKNVAGLNNGADVRVGGIHLGTVRQISLPEGPEGKLTVVMDLAESTREVIRKDSVATIKTEGLLGNKYVEVTFGSQKAPAIESGDEIRGETPEDFSDAALAAMNQVRDAASSLEDDADAVKHNFLLRGFFKRRGYESAEDLDRNRIGRLPKEPSSKEFEYDAKDLFDEADNAKLKNKKTLDAAGKFLEENKFRLAVVATSLEMGDSRKDRLISEARAKVVRDYLVENFQFDDTRLKLLAMGKRNGTSKVEILVYEKPSAKGAE